MPSSTPRITRRPSDGQVYQSLVELCTILVAGDATAVLFIDSALHTLSESLTASPSNGDIAVLGTRAVALVLDRYPAYLHSKRSGIFRKCLRAVLKLTARHDQLQYHQTSDEELVEELLKCLPLVEGSSESDLGTIRPGAAAQLRFCKSVIQNDSLWVRSKVLRHLCYVARSGEIKSGEPLHQELLTIYRSQLEFLLTTNVEYAWGEVLRFITEGFITIRAFLSPSSATSSSGAAVSRKKRPHGGPAAGSSTAPENSDGKGKTAPCPTHETILYLKLCEMICQSSTSDEEMRRLVFACANAVIDADTVVHHLPLNDCYNSVMVLSEELAKNSHRHLRFSNPFAFRSTKDDASAEADEADEDEEMMKNLRSLQWIVPDGATSLMSLLTKLFGADPCFTEEYVWAWRADDDMYYWYTAAERLVLSGGFLRGASTVELPSRKREVSFISMIEMNRRRTECLRVYHQAIPCRLVYGGGFLQATEAWGQRLMARLPSAETMRLRHCLRSMSFGGTELARFGKMVYLLIVSAGEAENSEDVKAALRNIVAEGSPAVMEEMSQRLLQKDRQWASILLEAGVADAIVRSQTSSNAQHSPVAQRIRREAATSPSTPPLQPLSLPRHTSPQRLRDVLEHSTSAELMQFLHVIATDHRWNRAEVVADAMQCTRFLPQEAVTGKRAVLPWVARVQSGLTAYILKELQDISAQYNTKHFLETVSGAPLLPIHVCHNTQASSFICPSKHPLQLHCSTNWKCDQCGQADQYSAWSCRKCNFDLCHICAAPLLHRIDVSVTATAGDTLRAWRLVVAPEKEAKEVPTSGGNDVSGTVQESFFFSSDRVLSTATPATMLTQQNVHYSTTQEGCTCGIRCPAAAIPWPPLSALDSTEEAKPLPPTALLEALLLVFGGPAAADASVQHLLVETYENSGTQLFLLGANGLPPRLRQLTSFLAPHFSMAMKHMLCHFVAVGCRRYALQQLQDHRIMLHSLINGDVYSNGIGVKIAVPRGNMKRAVEVLYDTFHRLPSLRTKIDSVFEGEEGIGNGPSRELYTELSAYFRETNDLWYTREDDGVVLPFPSIKTLHSMEFFVLGAACARAFVDEYHMELDLLPQAWPLVLQCRDTPPNDPSMDAMLEAVMSVLDPVLWQSFVQLQTASDAAVAAMDIEDDAGAPICSAAAAKAYVRQSLHLRLAIGLANLHQFSCGICAVIEVESLWFLSGSELSTLLCGAEANDSTSPLFTEEELSAQVLGGSGYAKGSSQLNMLLSIVGSEFNRQEQRHFLEFLTGTSRMPVNGLAGLGRKITVAKKDMEDDNEKTLPSCSTCFLYLKMPPYSKKEIMKERLLLAITEGRKNFSLS